MMYFDTAATTKPSAEAIAAASAAYETFGNPSSLHRMGLDAQKLVDGARLSIAEKLSVDKKNIYFTSGGTEANNWAISGAAHMLKRRGDHIITTKIEHPSVLEAFRRLEGEGFRVTYLDVSSDGVISLDEFSEALCDKTILVSIMHVNNETGVIQPIDKLKAVMKEKAPVALLHSDCVQSFCKADIKCREWGLDMVSVSAHKIGGLKGTGALYCNNTRLVPLLVGGGQQGSMRPGTENVAGICAFGAAVQAYKYESEYMLSLRASLRDKLCDGLPNIKINGDINNLGCVLNVSFVGIKAEILLHTLEKHEMYVSTGSACSTHKPQPSHVLSAMGLSKKEIEGAVRLSFDMDYTEADMEKAAEILIAEVCQIRKYM